MGTIYVKNGNWDEACGKLKADMDGRAARFDAKIEAAFAPPGKSAAMTKSGANAPGASGPSAAGSLLSRSLGRKQRG